VFRFEREKDSWILVDFNVRVFLDGKQVCALGITQKESKAWIEAFAPIVGGAAYYFGNRSGDDSDNSDWTAKLIAQE
jgi:hypothetical protein